MAGGNGVDRIAEFLAMGGYAAYVWPALGLTAAVMIGLAWHARRSLRLEEAAAAELERSAHSGRAGEELESEAGSAA